MPTFFLPLIRFLMLLAQHFDFSQKFPLRESIQDDVILHERPPVIFPHFAPPKDDVTSGWPLIEMQKITVICLKVKSPLNGLKKQTFNILRWLLKMLLKKVGGEV